MFKQLPICDYHMHTPLCGHAIGEPREYALQAVRIGLEEIGFSDHAPMVFGSMPGVTMEPEDLPTYYKMMESVRDEFKDRLRIKIGIEADFIPGYEEKTRFLLDQYPYDYVLGAVHFIKEWGFDNPAERSKWDAKDINQVYADYFELLRQSALTNFFNIIAHCDLVKKFGHRPTDDIASEVRKTAEVFRFTGVSIEINTSGLRKPVKEMYPSLDHLKIYCKQKVPLTFGSDAHDPKDVGKDFTNAVNLAKAAGYSEYVTFKNRKIDRIIKL